MLSKLLVLILALAMVLSLFSCARSDEKDSESETSATDTSTEKETGTEAPTQSETESTKTTESETVKSTESETAVPTESDTQNETESEKATESETVSQSESVSDKTTESESGSQSESGSDDETESETVSQSETESATEPAKETECEHPYAATQEGHWKPACSVCGKKEGKIQDHEYKEYTEDEGDLIYYSYVCTICHFEAYGQEVPYEINLFYPAGEISNLGASGGVEGNYRFESGIGYGSFARDTSSFGASARVVVEDSGSTEDDPSGRYVAIKLRLPRSQTSITLHVQSVHANRTYDLKLSSLKPGWITLVLDLAKIAKTTVGQTGETVNMGYYPDSESEFYLKSFALSTYINSGESLDISYVLFCEEKQDVMEFIKGEKNYYVYEDALNLPPEKHTIDCKHDYIIDDENGTHTLETPCYICGTAAVTNEPHTFVEISGSGRNSYECSVCGYAKYYKVVPEEVNKYYSASELNAGGIIYYPYTGFNHGLHIEPGDAYTRYEGPINFKDKVAQVIFARDDKDQNPVNNGDAENGIRINVGDAVYFVLRVRVNTPGLSPLSVTISTTGHAGYDSGEGCASFSIPVASTDQNTWTTYVINLAQVFPTKYVKDSDGNYVVDTYYFTMCHGTFAEGVTLDLSYMAYCSSWEEVSGLVDEDKAFYLTDAKGEGNWVNTGDGEFICMHIPGKAEVTNNANGSSTYKFPCTLCGQTAMEKTVGSDVSRYYHPGDISSTATTYYQVNGVHNGQGASTLYDGDNDVVFSRYTGYVDTNPVTGQAIWQRAQADMWAGQTASQKEQYTESVGQAEWLVIRARTSNPAQAFSVTYSTTAYSAEEGAPLGRSGGMVGIKVPLNAAKAGTWTTYVMNLKNIDPASYVKDDMGTPDDPWDDEYIIDSFYIEFPAFPKSTFVDIEYMAFVEGSWAEIGALVEEDTVVVVADRTGNYGKVDIKSGKCVDGNHAFGYTTTLNSDGSQTNKVACSGCGEVLREQNVSADINKFFDITAIGCFNQVNKENASGNHSDAKVISATIDQDTGDRFVRVEATFGNTHVNLNGGVGGGALSTYTISTGRYAVLKFRSDGREFGFDAQTGDYASHTSSTYKPAKEDEGKWLIFVIDLAAFTNETGVKGYTTNSTQTVKFRLTTGGSSKDDKGFWIEDPYYIDISYFAVVDNIAEAESLIGNETYRLYENTLGSEYVEKTPAAK